MTLYVSQTNARLRDFELYSVPALEAKIASQTEAVEAAETKIQGEAVRVQAEQLLQYI